MAGASGGSGACSRRPGRGAVLKTRLFLEKGYRLLIALIGHKGTSACDTNPSHPVCQLDETSEDFEDRCLELLLNTTDPEELLSDGGGGGGGATVVFIEEFGLIDIVFLISGGGGGSSALHATSNHTFSDASTIINSSDVIETSGFGSTNMSAGVGAALFGAVVNYPSDGGGFDRVSNLDAIGGQDCLLDSESAFPRTVGGYGGGGGGCGNGGGGGGYIGGNVTAEGHQYPGGGGSSRYDIISDDVYSLEFDGYNEGDGFVEVFLEGCNCAYDCIPDFKLELFECICPEGTRVSLFDCIEGMYVYYWHTIMYIIV